MPKRLYTVTFKTDTADAIEEQPVEADEHEEDEGYLMLYHADGSLAGVFALDYVERFTFVPLCAPKTADVVSTDT